MNKVLYNILDNVSEGIVILNDKFEIVFWNNSMELFTATHMEDVLKNHIYEVLPKINTKYIVSALNTVLSSGSKMFFSAAMHKDMLNVKVNFNLKASRFEENGVKFLLLEFTDVTNQFIQVSRLKDYIKGLNKANRQLKEQEKIIRNLAYYDNLTGVANRTLFYELAEKFLSSAKRNNSIIGLMFIDVNKFKSINDTFGHKAGDEVLIKVAEILNNAVRKSDIVARHGGDEFLILLPYIKDYNNYQKIITRINNDKGKKIVYEGNKINISLSMGVSFYPDNGDTIDKLIAEADKAMYKDKNKQHN
ncbi:MAG: diguanylate cyclase domain-containing protein [Solirubrobacterales bacterium]